MTRSLKLSLCLMLLMCGRAGAMAQMSDGSIRGEIRDVHGVPLAGVRVTATSADVPLPLVVITGAEGAYRLSNLIPGRYALTAEISGFTGQVRENVVVHAGLNLTIHFVLAVGAVRETITVKAETPLLETSSAGQAVNVSGELQRSLPLAARKHWSEVLRLVPGVVSTDTTADQASVFFVHGAGVVSGSTIVDGADISSAVNPWTGYLAFPEDAVADVQIRTSGLDASAPLGMGAAANVVIKSGTNRYQGSGTWAYTPRRWVSDNTPAAARARR